MNSIHSHNKKKNNNINNNEKIYAHKMPTPQNRILLDTPCKVCGDNSSGKHYGIHTCDGCSGFFKRSIRKQKAYPCKSGDNSCPITRSCRNQCRSCRLRRCREMGMLEESVQQERGPRNSTSGSSARGSTPATTMRMHARESTGGGGGIGPLRGGSSGTGRGLLGNCAISHSDPYPITAGRLMMPNISLAPSSTTTAAAAAATSATLSQVLGPELQPHLAAAAYHNHLLSQFPQLQDPTSQYNEMLSIFTGRFG